MKAIFLLAALAATLVLTGCEHTKQAVRFTPERITEVKVKSPGQRAVYVAATYLSLLEMDQRIAALGNTVASLQSDAVAEQTVNSLRDQRADIDPLFENLANADELTWEQARRSFETALIHLDTARKSAQATYDK